MLETINDRSNKKYYNEFKTFIKHIDNQRLDLKNILEIKGASHIESYIASKEKKLSNEEISEIFQSDIDKDVLEIEKLHFSNIRIKDIAHKKVIFRGCKFSCCYFEFSNDNCEFIQCEFSQGNTSNGDYRHNLNILTVDENSVIRFKKSNIFSMSLKVIDATIAFISSNVMNLTTFESVDCKLHIHDTKIAYSNIVDIDIKVFAFVMSSIEESIFCPDSFRGNIATTDDKSMTFIVQVYSQLSQDYLNKNNRYYHHVYFLMGKLLCDQKEYKNLRLNNSNGFERMCSYFVLPIHIFKLIVFWIIAFAVVYLLIGLRYSGDDSVLYSITNFSTAQLSVEGALELANNFYNALYFSCLTFTTVGYGDFVIRSGWEIIPMIQMLLGVLFTGILTGSIFKRYV